MKKLLQSSVLDSAGVFLYLVIGRDGTIRLWCLLRKQPSIQINYNLNFSRL